MKGKKAQPKQAEKSPEKEKSPQNKKEEQKKSSSNSKPKDNKDKTKNKGGKDPQGGIVKQEAPIHISNLSLIDPKSGKATRVSIKHEGKNVIRISKKSGEEIK